MAKQKAVIFDLDGCLVDSEILSLSMIAAEMQDMGLDVDWRELRGLYLGKSLASISEDITARLGRPCPPEFPDRFERRLFAAYETELRAIPGAETMLQRLQDAGTACAIATGGSVRRMGLSLKIVGLDGFFGGMTFSADQVERGKPAPDLFLFAAQNLNVPTEDCVVLEDSPHGVTGAVAAGMRAIGFVGGTHLDGQREAHAAILETAGAGVVIAALDELPGLVLEG